MKRGKRRKGRKEISIKDRDDLSQFKESILEGITKIEARLHRIILFGDYSYEHLEKKLGKLKEDEAFDRKRMPRYHGSALRWFEKNKLTIFHTRIKNAPECRIEFNFSSPEWLMLLCEKLPKLKISSIEYAVDIFCGNPHQVADLFYLLLHYMYFTYKTVKVQHFGGSFYGYDEKEYQRGENAGFRFGEIENNHVKIYERGDDENRQKNGKEKTPRPWYHDDVDRVRVEFTFRRKYLLKNGPDELKDLKVHPEFEHRICRMFQFKVFKRPGKLPEEIEENYWYKDEKGKKVSREIIQEVYIHANKSGMKNPRQYLKNAKGFKALKRKLTLAMQEFDGDWVESRKRFSKKQLGVSN